MPDMGATITVVSWNRDRYNNLHVTDENGTAYRSSRFHTIPDLVQGAQYSVRFAERNGIRFLNAVDPISGAVQGTPPPPNTPMVPAPRPYPAIRPAQATTQTIAKDDGRLTDKEKNDLMIKMNINTNSTAMAVAYKDLLIACGVVNATNVQTKIEEIDQKRKEFAHDMYQAISGKKMRSGFLERTSPRGTRPAEERSIASTQLPPSPGHIAPEEYPTAVDEVSPF